MTSRTIRPEDVVGLPRTQHASTWAKPDDPSPARPSPTSSRRPFSQRLKLKEDYRARLPPSLARFSGYKPPNSSAPYPPLPFLSFLRHIPLKIEVAVTASLAAFVSILILESISATSTTFRDAYHSPLIVASFGATAVLIFGAIESPLSQPRNVLGGQILSAIVAVCLTRLFALDKSYMPALENDEFHYGPFINGALSMSLALFVMFLTNTIHPPGGATALIASTSREGAMMSWKFIPFVIVSAVLMTAWAVVVNNLGRRRYPVFWWSAEKVFVVDQAPESREDEEIALGQENHDDREAEDRGGTDNR